MLNPMQMFGNMQNLIANFNQFRQQIEKNGINPQQQVMQLMQQGKMSQQQFEELRQVANTLSGMFGNRP